VRDCRQRAASDTEVAVPAFPAKLQHMPRVQSGEARIDATDQKIEKIS
jgi:hypothetical protein